MGRFCTRCVLRPVHDARRATERSGAAQFGTVPRISRMCGGAAPLAAMPCRAAPIGSSSIFAAWRSAAEVTLGLRTWIRPIGKYYKNTTKSCVGFYPGIPSRSACAS